MNSGITVFYYIFTIFMSSIFIFINIVTRETIPRRLRNVEPMRIRIINRNTNIKFKKIKKTYFQQNEVCCICLDEFNDNNDENIVYMSKCNHFYHKNCITTWIRSGNNQSFKCPMCLGDM